MSGQILARIEEAGFTVRAMRMIHMSNAEAEGFYHVHRERPFFGGLTAFMSSGPCVVLCLEAPNAIRKWRDLMGATDPAKAEAGTLRKEFGASIDNNATHGSDAPAYGGLRARLLLPWDGAPMRTRQPARSLEHPRLEVGPVGLQPVGGNLTGFEKLGMGTAECDAGCSRVVSPWPLSRTAGSGEWLWSTA